MSGLTVLSDSAVHRLLIGLSKDEIIAFQASLSKCLQGFSVGTERQYQPTPGIINRPNGQKTLFRPFTSPTAVGTKIIVDPAPKSDNTKLPLQGVVALCDENGLPKGIINGGELTGYRTSLIAIIPYMWRRNTENVVVYGSGKQALWHIRLMLALRGMEIKTITVVNRSESRAREMLDKIAQENAAQWKSSATMEYLNPSGSNFEQSLKGILAEADAIFCTVPSYEPLFPAEYILNQGKRTKSPYISAIGSWQSNMIELDPALIKGIVNDAENGFHPEHGSAGAILVDDRTTILTHTGEAVKSELKLDDMVEVGKIFYLRENEPDKTQKEKLNQWLAEGLVVYKSVGVSVTDLAAGERILALAKEHNLGVHIEDF
ncbi:NAD(P)-binding protein [Annulohypoxylon maeteangense]|uniref:NAD(P)-binding protein n=1 Tax=Annulohypoxylon maeteangense TaxID=1927788 RepID=UPI00200879D4|nr:NAD(P)-binding protein [Annulohypoxylon maeteangense]KAI0886756.1 NAD(P)-binding protein [Annulohypoxylon maeteangense]